MALLSTGNQDALFLIDKAENLERVGRSRHRRCGPGRAHRLLHPRLLATHRRSTKLYFADQSLGPIGRVVNALLSNGSHSPSNVLLLPVRELGIWHRRSLPSFEKT